MRAFDVGREERGLFVFTHPDDELRCPPSSRAS